jgi:SAM-dependent methyltransferase
MRPEAYETLAGRQDDYWWHRARRRMAAGLLRRYGLPSRGHIVDLGSGAGGNLDLTDPWSPRVVVGVDFSTIALEYAREKRPGARLIRATLNQPLPFADQSVDAVTIFNVLYHQWVRDEVSVLAEVSRVLKPGGLLLVTEPAFAQFERQMDDIVMTRRRYEIPEFAAMCHRAGLDVVFASYFTSFGAPVVWAMKTMERWFNRSAHGHVQADLRPINPVVNSLLCAIAGLEASAIAHGWRMPIGLTLVMVARRP